MALLYGGLSYFGLNEYTVLFWAVVLLLPDVGPRARLFVSDFTAWMDQKCCMQACTYNCLGITPIHTGAFS